MVKPQAFSLKVLTDHKFKTEKKKWFWDFPGGAVVKNPPANARNTDLSPGPGRSHMLWSN